MKVIDFLEMAINPCSISSKEDGVFYLQKSKERFIAKRIPSLEEKLGKDSIALMSIRDQTVVIDVYFVVNNEKAYAQIMYAIKEGYLNVYTSGIENNDCTGDPVCEEKIKNEIQHVLTYLEEHPKTRLHLLTENVKMLEFELKYSETPTLD